MALDQSQWTALVGVLVILVAIFVYNRMRASQSPIQTGTDDDVSVDTRLSRFAVHEGNVVGESVAIDGDQLVLKQAGVFRTVPLAQVEAAGAELAIHGDVDWTAAEAAGAAWLERNRKGTDDQVTQDLTTSDDVKAPAREAFERRQKEMVGSDSEE